MLHHPQLSIIHKRRCINHCIYACTCQRKKYMANVFHNQVGSLFLFVWTYCLQIIWFSRWNNKNEIVWDLEVLISGEGGEWGQGINSIQIFVELQNRTVCNNANMPVEIVETMAKIKIQNSFCGFLYQDFFSPLKHNCLKVFHLCFALHC